MSTTLPNGVICKRGDAILVEGEGGAVLTAFVDHIDQSNGYPYVTANIMVGSLHKADKTIWSYDGVGFRHVSTPLTITGKRFCLVSEGDAAEAALRGHYALVTPADPIQGSSPADIKPEQPTQPLDPADLNQDGTVTKAERKQYNREHPAE